jgi:hypothetical protein
MKQKRGDDTEVGELSLKSITLLDDLYKVHLLTPGEVICVLNLALYYNHQHMTMEMMKELGFREQFSTANIAAAMDHVKLRRKEEK